MGRSLDDYAKKRDFDGTPEPTDDRHPDWAGDEPIFVIQKHDASTLHYDVRLEIDGVLVSWSVPKGPSTDPRVKRLAVPSEPHPLAYADFEGTIPEGSYGAGTVLVWDRGSYRNAKQDDDVQSVAEQYDEGHLTVWLDGEKLSGGYAFVRTGSDDARWLMVKMDDDAADARRNPTSTEPDSVKTGRSMEEIAASSA